jgi:hypothetical protein
LTAFSLNAESFIFVVIFDLSSPRGASVPTPRDWHESALVYWRQFQVARGFAVTDWHEIDRRQIRQLGHASFVLRCWVNSQGQIRAHLVDVRTGIAHPVADLAELPTLTRRLIMAIYSLPEETGEA